MPRIVHVSYTALTNHGKIIPYMHHTSFLFVFLFPFSVFIDLGLLVGSCAVEALKISLLSLILRRRRPRRGTR